MRGGLGCGVCIRTDVCANGRRSWLSASQCNRRGGDSVSAQQRRVRRKALAGDTWIGLRIPRLRPRRLAGHPARQRNGLAGTPAAAINAETLPEQSQRTFSDVTRAAGLDVELYGMGVAAGDYNNDGFPDIFISCVGQSRLFRNTGKGTFIDVTKASGLLNRHGFSTSALWFDYDRDGLLDLFVCNYVRWSPEHDVFCSLRS